MLPAPPVLGGQGSSHQGTSSGKPGLIERFVESTGIMDTLQQISPWLEQMELEYIIPQKPDYVSKQTQKTVYLSRYTFQVLIIDPQILVAEFNILFGVVAIIAAIPTQGASLYLLAVADAALGASMIIVNMEKLSDLKNGNAYTNPKFLGMDQERLDQLGTALMVVNLSMLAKHGLYKFADKLANSKTMSAMGDSWAAWKKQVEHELDTARVKPLKGKGEASLRTEEMGKPELKPAPKPGIEGMGNSGGGSSQLWKQGTPLREINYTISTDAKRHLIATNDPISGKKGVNGTHNSDEFYNSLKSTGKDIENMISPEDITYDIDFPGLATIKYKIPKSDGKGTYFDEYKYIGNPKTVYDPRVYGDEQMYQWGLEAMNNGYLNGYLICGEASNGMKFVGYFRNGEITNFHPVTSFDN